MAERPFLVGRDSSLVRLIGQAANSCRIVSSEPGRSVRWKMTTDVLSCPVGGWMPWRATTTKRVALSGWSSMSVASTSRP